jgi:hypothetical protein
MPRSIGLTPEQLVASVKTLLFHKTNPLPIQLEAGSDDNLKDLLT